MFLILRDGNRVSSEYGQRCKVGGTVGERDQLGRFTRVKFGEHRLIGRVVYSSSAHTWVHLAIQKSYDGRIQDAQIDAFDGVCNGHQIENADVGDDKTLSGWHGWECDLAIAAGAHSAAGDLLVVKVASCLIAVLRNGRSLGHGGRYHRGPENE